MSTNEEILKSLVEGYDELKKMWCPLAIVYDPVKVGSIDSTDAVAHDRAVERARRAAYTPSDRALGRPECTVFVARLPRSINSQSLAQAMGMYGPVTRCRVVEDLVTGRSRGYGFVEYSSEAAALNAYRRAHRTLLQGKEILVDMECQRLLPGWVPRRLGGGFCGRKESGQLRFGCRAKPFKKPISLLSEADLKERRR